LSVRITTKVVECTIPYFAAPQARHDAKLSEKPDISWHHAVRLIVEPDATNDEDDDDDGSEIEDDEDLSDIDE